MIPPQARMPGTWADGCVGYCSSNFPQETIAEIGLRSYCHHGHYICSEPRKIAIDCNSQDVLREIGFS